MRRYFKYLTVLIALVLSGVVYSNLDKIIRAPALVLGLGTDADVAIKADRTANDPFILWNEANSRWEFSNDGTSTKSIGAGKGIHQNILQDSNFDIEDKQTAPYSSSQGSTLAVEAGDVAFEEASLSWTTANGVVDILSSAQVPVPRGYFSSQCEARVFFKGGPAGMKFRVTDGTNTLVERDLSTPSVYTETSLLFVCPSSGDVKIEVESPSSSTGQTVLLDDFYVGEALTDTSSEIATEWTEFEMVVDATTTAPTKGTAVTDKALWRRVGDSMEITYAYNQTAGGGTAGSGTYLWKLPTGYEIDLNKIEADTNLNPNGRTVGMAYVSGSTTEHLGTMLVYDSTSLWLVFDNGTGVGTVCNSASCSFASPVIGRSFTAKVPIKGWASTVNSIPAEMQGWFVDVNIQATTNPVLNSAVFIDPYSDNANMTLNTGSADAQIPCYDGASEGLDCPSATFTREVPGVVFDAPLAGVYEVCAMFTHRYHLANQSKRTMFLWHETQNDQPTTIFQTGKTRMNSGGNKSANISSEPTTICDQFNFTTPGQKTMRLKYAEDGTFTVNEMAINGGGTQAPNMRITVKPVAPHQPAPLLISSLNTPSTDKTFAYVSATIEWSGGVPQVRAGTEYGDWIDSFTDDGVGRFTAHFKAGTFSGTPNCTCTVMATSNAGCMGTDEFVSPVTNSDRIGIRVATNSANSPVDATGVVLTCHGPR